MQIPGASHGKISVLCFLRSSSCSWVSYSDFFIVEGLVNVVKEYWFQVIRSWDFWSMGNFNSSMSLTWHFLLFDGHEAKTSIKLPSNLLYPEKFYYACMWHIGTFAQIMRKSKVCKRKKKKTKVLEKKKVECSESDKKQLKTEQKHVSASQKYDVETYSQLVIHYYCQLHFVIFDWDVKCW